MISSIHEILQYRSMLWSMVQSELRTRYKGSSLGFLWTFVNPLLMLIVYSMVFSVVMRINMRHYSVFLFIGLLAWNLFAQSVQSSTGVIVRQSSLVNKIYFPREILPLSIVVGGVINYLLSLVVLIPFLIFMGYFPTWQWLYLPIILFFTALLTTGFALLVSALNVYFRDLEHMLSVIMTLWFYLTPIVYPISMLPHRYAQIMKLNPVTDIVLPFQSIFYYGQSPHWKLFMYGCFFSFAVLVFGYKVFHVLSRRFAEEV